MIYSGMTTFGCICLLLGIVYRSLIIIQCIIHATSMLFENVFIKPFLKLSIVFKLFIFK